MRILLFEDELSNQTLIKLKLNSEGYDVEAASNGKDGLTIFEEQHFDLIILDILMPEMNGYEVCERIRLKNIEIPILFLSAKGKTLDKIKGLEMGADDYLAKPFNLQELVLRVKNLLKRVYTDVKLDANEIQFGDNKVNFATFEAFGNGESFHLTKIETRLLKMLYDRRNQVVSRDDILHHVWGYDVIPSTRTIDNFLLNFRKRFEKDTKNPEFFHSIRGIGYKFTPEG